MSFRPADKLAESAVSLMDSGDVDALEAVLREHPTLVSDKIDLSGDLPGAYFSEPRLLWFIAENPVRTGRMAPNVVDVARRLISLGQVFGVPHMKADLEALLVLVASGRVAREAGQQAPLIRLAVAEGATPDCAIQAALGHQELAAVRTLLACGAAQTLECSAALGDHVALAANIETASVEARQRALSAAVLFGEAEAAEYLLESGADPNLFNPDGFHAHSTPLHQAVFYGFFPVVDVLLKAGADPAIKDKIHGGDALGWARHAAGPKITERMEAAISDFQKP